MDVLHYSFSLSACPKCHLLVCKHTSLANLDFRGIEQHQEEKQSIIESNNTTSKNVKNRYQRLSSHGMNFYILPSTANSNNRHSWTTFGSDSNQSSNTLENSSINNETFSDNIPFADENIINSSLTLKPSLNQIVRTQSERCQKNFKPRICLTKSYSFSTIYTTPKSSKSLALSSHIQQNQNQTKNLHKKCSVLLIIILIISYLLTNTLDIVLLYIYYHTNYIYFIMFSLTLLICDIILWINHLIDIKNLSTRLLLIPFILRLYILYQLVELMIIVFSKSFIDNTTPLFDSTSTPSTSSTTTTLETNISQTTDASLIHDQHVSQSYKTLKRRIFHYLTLFYIIHSSLAVFANLYFWSNNFQPSTKSTLNMNNFLPQWTTDNDILLSTPISMIPVRSSLTYVSKFDNDQKHTARRAMSLNWTRPIFYRQIPLSIRLPSAYAFIITSIFYHLIINYCFLSTFLIRERTSFIIILSILSRFCLIITRIYTFIFLFHLNAWWFTITFFIVHFCLMISLLFDRSTFKDNQKRIFIKLIFSFLTHCSINDISINALISLENISIFLHRLYLETFSSHNETTLRLIIFISILISLQIIGFLFDILSKNMLYRTDTNNQVMSLLLFK
ncbi:unnamed protein product [Rotaria magnacalcarata]|uniref:Uncharacterized protein n=2 Tax=Rotaria magnacalcarata TaxID=392030 RepID=A0A8S2J1F9_9BILA|nr:unnamed protein product [Rotaria magnacalcarata]CAF3780909.1 unnamed protein product [Rotaria magnacalcarata]CAF3917794.1 unnamed protein product [Rotaria magnacalcarata]